MLEIFISFKLQCYAVAVMQPAFALTSFIMKEGKVFFVSIYVDELFLLLEQ